MVDIDFDIAAPKWEELKKQTIQRICDRKEEAGLLFLQVTRKGAHCIFRRPSLNVSQSENLRLIAQMLDVSPDMNAKDITRVFFCGDSSTLLYLHDDVFKVEDAPFIPEEEGRTPAAATMPSTQSEQASAAREHLMPDGRLRYKNLPFSPNEVIARYWHLHGGEPHKGCRNKATFEIAQQLAYFTADSDLLDQWIPCYDGFTHSEKMKCIASALQARPCVPPRKLRLAMDAIMNDEAKSQTILMPRKWPMGLRESMAVAPQGMQQVYLPALTTVIGALATGVQVDYNGKRSGLNLFCFLVGEAGSGKGSMTPVINAWTAPLRAADAMNHEKERAWKQEKRKARNKQHQPEEPELEFRLPTLNSTLPNFVLRLQQSHGKHAFAYSPEADIVCSKWKNDMLEFGNISRMAWDNDPYCREAKSEGAVSVQIEALKLNWLLAGTPDALHRLITSPTDGVVNRLALASTPDNTFAQLQLHRSLTPVQEERIAQVSILLSLMKGCIHPTKVETRARDWTELIRIEAEQTDDRVLARARMRTHENAVRMVVCVLLCKAAEKLLNEHGFEGAKSLLSANPHAWLTVAEKAQTPAVLDLVDRVADYLIDQQMRYFRSRIEKKYASADYATSPIGRRPAANDAVYCALPQTFSFDDAVKTTAQVKGNAVSRNSVSCMLRRWAQAGKLLPQEGGYAKL